MIDFFMLLHGYPFKRWWHLWTHRHETPAERQERVTASRRRLRELYRQEIDSFPESREVMEWQVEVDAIMDRICGKDE
jgi:hypothetical protein